MSMADSFDIDVLKIGPLCSMAVNRIIKEHGEPTKMAIEKGNFRPVLWLVKMWYPENVCLVVNSTGDVQKRVDGVVVEVWEFDR